MAHIVDSRVDPKVRGEITLSTLCRWGKQLLNSCFDSPKELSITLVDDAAIRRLNRDYRGKDTPTDVLSFSMQEGKRVGQSTLLGDIVISIPTAKRQARMHGQSLADEVLTLLIHGFCHLLGYDHDTDKEEKAMKREQRRLWIALTT